MTREKGPNQRLALVTPAYKAVSGAGRKLAVQYLQIPDWGGWPHCSAAGFSTVE